MMRDARKLLDLDAKHTFMIGDNMGTDILGAVQLGYQSVLVLSGSCNREDVEKVARTYWTVAPPSRYTIKAVKAAGGDPDQFTTTRPAKPVVAVA